MALEKDEMAILVKSCHSVYKSLGIKNRVVSEEEEIQKRNEKKHNLFKRTVFGQNLRAGRCFIEKAR